MSLTTNIRVHARQLAFKPNLQIIRRSRRPLLRGLEQARRSALAHHVPRIAPMGARVLINGTRYQWVTSKHDGEFQSSEESDAPTIFQRFVTPPASAEAAAAAPAMARRY